MWANEPYHPINLMTDDWGAASRVSCACVVLKMEQGPENDLVRLSSIFLSN